jgi:hypothetical protein
LRWRVSSQRPCIWHLAIKCNPWNLLLDNNHGLWYGYPPFGVSAATWIPPFENLQTRQHIAWLQLYSHFHRRMYWWVIFLFVDTIFIWGIELVKDMS